MKTTLVFVGFLLLATAVAQQHDKPHPKGVIYGIAIGQDGQPAKGIGLTACPLGDPPGAKVPHAKATDKGEHRFESLPRGGRDPAYAEHEDTAESSFSTRPARDTPPSADGISPGHT